MYSRIYKPPQNRSFFLFGARGTGKSTLLRMHFPKDRCAWFDLNDAELETRYLKNPGAFEQELKLIQSQSPIKWVVVDEIQKCPQLLNTAQKIMSEGHFSFGFTGSSARKLKRGQANLLAGRAFEGRLFPLTHSEAGDDFDLDSCLQWGSLPEVFQLPPTDRNAYLRTYVNTYLREEIQAEQVIRNVPVFRAFIEVAGQSSGKILNYSKLARDVGTDPVTVKNYFSVLEDTLLGFFLPAFHTSIRKRQSLHPKFYFFDLGVLNAAQGLLTVPVVPQTSRYGELFEAFVILEIHRLSQYLELDWKLSYLMTHGKVEVDLIVDRPGQKRAFIEIKSTTEVRDDHLRSLKHFQEEFADTEFFLISQDPRERKVGQILCLHWKNAFREIGLREA